MNKFDTYPNYQLEVVNDNKPRWNNIQHRRKGFHNLHLNTRYAISLRSEDVLELMQESIPSINDTPGLSELTENNLFSAMVVANGQSILFEKYADDFSDDNPHSIQSITKMTVNLMVGELVASDQIDLSKKVKDYLPEIGSGYAEATLQDVLDMDIENDYSEDYSDPFASSYAHEETIGWRLPASGTTPINQFEFLCGIESDDLVNRTGYVNYKSANTDVLAWIVERVSEKPIRHWLIEIVEAAGLEAAFHISTDRDGFPIVDGGGCLVARDLARFGLLFARLGGGVNGKQVGNAEFIECNLSRNVKKFDPPKEWMGYSNQVFTSGNWIGHSGYGGQFLLIDLKTGTVGAFLSVLDNKHAWDSAYTGKCVKVLQDIASTYP